MPTKLKSTTGNSRIDASPTKDFFIDMLTRDIPLTRAILDLVDNSVDGAKRLRPNGDYSDLSVRIVLNRETFRITDNCGGIPEEVAREYAFRFGRPKNVEGTPGSMGRFGVGMKRTFFRLGRHFSVSSTTSNSHFVVDVDVDQWLKEDKDDPDNWHFEFKELKTGMRVSQTKTGTDIVIDRLLEVVSDTFSLDNFCVRLIDEISHAHALTLGRQLLISLNAIPINHDPQKFFSTESIRPAFVEREIDTRSLTKLRDSAPISVKLYSGVFERNLHDGGWYIFCNGRLILRADQTAETVWGDRHQMRLYHADFAYFRGYAYLECGDGALLPWTTTKTGVDIDSPVYRTIQREMIELTKPVLVYLSNLAREKSSRERGIAVSGVLERAIKNPKIVKVYDIQRPQSFISPNPAPPPPGPKMQKIQYTKPAKEVEHAKRLLNVTSFTAVGERTFEYYMKYENDAEEV